MGSAIVQGELWGLAAQDWADLQEPTKKPLWEAMLDAANVGHGTRFFDVGCGGGASSSAVSNEHGWSAFGESFSLCHRYSLGETLLR